MYDSYVITSSCREVVRRFQANYPGVRVPSRETVRLLVNKFRETGTILDKKRNVKRRVLTEKKLMRVNANFLRRLMQKDSISNISCDKVRLFFILMLMGFVFAEIYAIRRE